MTSHQKFEGLWIQYLSCGRYHIPTISETVNSPPKHSPFAPQSAHISFPGFVNKSWRNFCLLSAIMSKFTHPWPTHAPLHLHFLMFWETLWWRHLSDLVSGFARWDSLCMIFIWLYNIMYSQTSYLTFNCSISCYNLNDF